MEQMSPMLQARIEQQKVFNPSIQNNGVKYVDLTSQNDTFETSTQSEKNNKSKTAKIIAIALSLAAAVTAAIFVLKKGKSIKLEDMSLDKFKQIKADKYTGKIEGSLKNGDKVVLEYVDGVLKKSARKGNVNFEKAYETINGEKIIKKTADGAATEFNITKIQQEVKTEQTKLKNILNNESLSSEELKKETDTIKFKSKNDNKEIENAVNTKKKAEAELKAKLEAEQKAEKERAEKLKEQEEKIAKIKEEQKKRDNLLKKFDSEITALKEERSRLENKGNLTLDEEIKLRELDVEIIKKEIAKDKDCFGYSIAFYDKEKELECAENSLKKAKQYYRTTQMDLSVQKREKHEYYCYGDTYSKLKGSPEYTKQTQDYKFYKDNKDLTLDSKVDLFEGLDKKPYDIPERMAIMADNSIRKTGNAYLYTDTPEIFKGIDKKEVMDKLSTFSRSEKPSKIITFDIGGKKITALSIGGGEVGSVYKLTDEAGNSAAIKIYGTERGRMLTVNSGLSEIATSKKLTADNVGDVPKFYMANAGRYSFDKNGEMLQDTPWMLSEFIEDSTKPKTGTKKVADWLNEHSMCYYDGFKNGRSQGGYILDLGGMASKDLTLRQTWGINGIEEPKFGSGLSDLLHRALNMGMSVEDILKIFQ